MLNLTLLNKQKIDFLPGVKVANIKSQKQRVITNEKARVRNADTRSELKTVQKSAANAIAEKIDDATKKVSLAQSKIASAAAKGRLHKKTAARRTSRLMKKAAN